MRVAHIRVRSFRNVRDARVEPGPDVCVLYGANAQGKTNFLEALYVLSNLQSFRTHRLRDLLPLDGAASQIEGEVESCLGSTRLELLLETKGRQPRINGKPPKTTSEYLAELPTVVFSPQDLMLARGSQDLRRRYLDRATFLANPGHLTVLRRYNRALRHRNAVLRSGGLALEVWTQQLARYGAEVHRGRRQTVARLHPTIEAIHTQIAGGNEQLELECRPSFEGVSIEEALLQRLADCEDRDRRVGHTGVGPHRDVVRIRLGGRNLDEHASQGQMRTVALGLKLALLQWGSEVRGTPPVFLLDDPGSELDGDRLGTLGTFLTDWPGQVLITGTQRDAVPLPAAAEIRYYRVEQGVLNPE
ncbi:MAG TPA: DNA replication/repair protein RecF [Deferrisomatales bacterium]|nr:DNA replication/repair protein RecF [Deferrisomatales bacterium]